MNRLRQAREYLGLTIDEVAAFMGWLPEWVEKAEAAEVAPVIRSIDEWDRLAKLFCRPVAWLQGGPEEPLEIPAELAEMMQSRKLSTGDRRELLDFAQFLHHRGQTLQ